MDYKDIDLESFLPDLYQCESKEELGAIRAIQHYYTTYFGSLTEEEEANTKQGALHTTESGRVRVLFHWGTHTYTIIVKGCRIYIEPSLLSLCN